MSQKYVFALLLTFGFFYLKCSSTNEPHVFNNLIELQAKDEITQQPLAMSCFLINEDSIVFSDAEGKIFVDRSLLYPSFSIICYPYMPLSNILLDSLGTNRKTLLFNLPPKLKEYQAYLIRGLELGYQFLTVIDYYNKFQANTLPDKLIVMRHDVDFDPITASAFAVIERQLKISTTYYFRWSTADQIIVNFVKKQGHEIGLHFETLATYAKNNSLTFAQATSEETMDVCRNLLREEIKQFEALFGDIHSIASHGDEWNIRNQFSNSQILKGQDLDSFYIKVNASSLENILRYFDLFVADSGNKWHPTNFQNALDANPQKLYVLVHPDWWKDNVRYSQKKKAYDYFMLFYYYQILQQMINMDSN